MREIRTSGLTRGSGRMALLRKRRLSLSTLPVKKNTSDWIPFSILFPDRGALARRVSDVVQ